MAKVEEDKQEMHTELVGGDPARVYPALTLALGAASISVKADACFATGDHDAVKKHTSSDVSMPGMPPIARYLQDALQPGAYVCARALSKETLASMEAVPENLRRGVAAEDAVGFLSRALLAAKNVGTALFI